MAIQKEQCRQHKKVADKKKYSSAFIEILWRNITKEICIFLFQKYFAFYIVACFLSLEFLINKNL